MAPPSERKRCTAPGCDRLIHARGFCTRHYQSQRKAGAIPTPTPADRFWAKVDKTETCWVWTGCTERGYGQFHFDKAKQWVHRWSYEQLVGPIPSGLHIDHLCRNRSCVNPKHLEAVTQQENNRRVGLARETCQRGHDEWAFGTNGNRYCRACRRERGRVRRQEAA